MQRPKTLSATFAKTVTQTDRYGDGRGGHGLSLLVKPGTRRVAKSWSQRLWMHGKAFNVGLGGYPKASLAMARSRALENAQMVERGEDPRSKPEAVPTFREALEKVIAIHEEGWRHGRIPEQWRSSLNRYAMKRLGNLPVDQITTADVMAVLTPIWISKRETARKVRQRIGAVMKWSIAQGYREDNPAGEAIGAALPKGGQQVEHHPALPYRAVGEAITTVRESDAWPATKLAFEFLTLTAVRSGEVRNATWDEIDEEEATWTIPAARMKKPREHRVPLSDAALEIVRRAKILSEGSRYLFPAPTGRPLSDSTLSKLLKENNIGCVPHGMRSSFRDWAEECTDASENVCEFALAHVKDKKMEAAYLRTDLFEKRRELMQQWADYIGLAYQKRDTQN